MSHRLQNLVIPKFDLSGKVAVVTGGTKGIGYGIAATYAAYGANVVVAARTTADCTEVAEELSERFKVRVLGIATDVTKEDDVNSLVNTTVEKLGKLDIMVCNAGGANTVNAIDMTEADWDRVLDVDLKGVFFTARAAARAMIAAGDGGKIISIASGAGLNGYRGISHYCAAKAGVINLTRALAGEWARYNINVNSICPGYIATAINDYGFRSKPDVAQKMVSKAMIHRFGKVEEIAACALLLATPYSDYTTGAAFVIDGGTSAQ